jgi:hypothetical protein
MLKTNHWFSICILCVSFTAFATTRYSLSSEFILGRVEDGNTYKPVVGALVTLYDADTDIMSDYTYTDNNGRFRLIRDITVKHMYVVASLSQRAVRANDIALQTNVQLRLPENEKTLWFVTWFFKLVDWIVPALIGLLVGLFPVLYNRCQGKQLKKRVISKEIITILNNKDTILGKASKGNCREIEIQMYVDQISKSLSNIERRLQPEELTHLSSRVEKTLIRITEQLEMALNENQGELHNIFSRDLKYNEIFGKIFNEFEAIEL